jgi:transcriptional regulator with XRE-family HTH domain
MARGPFLAAGNSTDASRTEYFRGLPQSFGRTLREQRVRREIGLRRLARVSGLSASYLSRIERDLVPPPSPKLIHELARALGADTEVLLAAAGIIPEHLLAVLRDRPAPMALLLSVMERMTDDEVLNVCDELRRRREAAFASP